MYSSSIYRILYLLYLLSGKDLTKNEIIEEFEKNNIKISSSTISAYINKLKSHGILIDVLKYKNKNIYHFKKPSIQLELNQDEISVIQDIKKLLFAEKNYNKIRKVVRLFYKLVFVTKDDEIRSKLLDFGYFSSLNWGLVRKLEKHCKTKDIIKLDYILPNGGNKRLIIHADDLKIGDWSNRLYLWGALDDADYLSYIPVDKIFMVEKVIQKNVPFKNLNKTLTFKISRKLYEEIKLNSKEELVDLDNNFAVISRPLEDNLFIIQRLLSFCPDLYYISDNKIKNLVKEKLEMIKASYEKEYE